MMTKQFFKVDKDIFTVVKDNNLTGSEFELLIALISLSDNEQGVCFASNKTLGKLINKSEKYVSRIISKLVLKQVISLKLIQKGTKININNKDYTTYRLIKVGVAQMDNTPLIQMDNQSRLKETKTKKTKINNLSSKTMDKQSKTTKKVKSVNNDKRDKIHKELFNYAMQLIQDKKSIGNKKAYAFTIVKNWLKAGLNTVEKIQEDKAKNHQVKSSKPVFVEKVPEYITKQPIVKQASQETINEIDHLMTKLCN